MKIKQTNRGFDYIEFTDKYGKKCSLQKSSLATEDAIWFGVDVARMHLTQEQVKELLPYLQMFVETGEIVESKKDVENETMYSMPERIKD